MPQTQGKNGLNCPLSAAAQLMAAAQGSLKIDLVALNKQRTKTTAFPTAVTFAN